MDTRPPNAPETSLTGVEWLAISIAAALSVLAIASTMLPGVAVLMAAWQVLAVVFLVLLFTRFSARTSPARAARAHPVLSLLLESLSWVLPVIASVTGIASTIGLLASHADGEGASPTLNGILGAVGVVVAWALLQAGFGEIYESVSSRLPPEEATQFPGAGDRPTLGDFLAMSFTIGTSFAVSGVTVASREIRRIVLIQSVVSFFYNAFLIAVAIQVLRTLIASGT